MLRILLFIILGWWGLSFSATISPIVILPPEVIPEREYGYLQGIIHQYMLEQLNVSSEVSSILGDLPDRENFTMLLKSRIKFLSPEKVLIELNLQDFQTGTSYWSSLREVSPKLFWTSLGQELEILKKTLNPEGATLDEPQEIPLKGISPLPKAKEEKSSWFNCFNPFRIISNLLSKKEDPLKIKVNVPPPPPPPGSSLKDSLPQVSPVLLSPIQVIPWQATFNERETVSSGERLPTIPTKEDSPWQWW